METYISMLRGINVGGKTIRMDALREMCAGLGLKDVNTYIQSGNIIFRYKKTPGKKLSALLKDAIKKNFTYDVPVITLTSSELKKVVTANPMGRQKTKDAAFLHVTFLEDEPDAGKVKALEGGDYQGHEFTRVDRAIYLYTPGGYGKTKLNNSFFEKKLKVTATTRNWKTTLELLRLAEEGS